MSHFIHALAIIALWKTDPGTFWVLTNPKSIATGGTAYVFIALLAATSFDRMVKALGPKFWGRLHWWGVGGRGQLHLHQWQTHPGERLVRAAGGAGDRCHRCVLWRGAERAAGGADLTPRRDY